jgi:hypothetical protein
MSYARWVALINKALLKSSAPANDTASDKEDGSGKGLPMEELSFDNNAMDIDPMGVECKFGWEEDISKLGIRTDWGLSAWAHHAAIDLLRYAMLKSSKWEVQLSIKVDARICKQLGKLKHLIEEHGSLADAMTASFESGEALMEDADALKAEMERFYKELKAFAEEAYISKEYLLDIISRVCQNTKKDSCCCT